MENYEENNAVPPDKFYNTLNTRFAGKVVASKQGYQNKGNILNGGTKFQGIYQIPYWNGTTVTNTLIGFYDKSFQQFNESTQTWNTITTVWPNVADAYTDGAIFENNLYIVNPLSGGLGGKGASATATVSGGAVNSVIVTQAGSGYSPVNSAVVFENDPSDTTGSGASGIIVLNATGGVTGITLFSNGSGYTAPPIVNILSGASDGIAKINLGSSNIINAASATANISNGSVISITVLNGGSGYSDTSPPAISISGNGSGAVAQAIVLGGVIQSIEVLVGGSGYPVPPSVTIDGVFSVVHGSVGTPRGTMIVPWVERLFVAGDSTAPNAWIASKPALANNPLGCEDFDTTNGAITDLLGENGVITAMRVLGTDMYMFKQDSIYTCTRDNFAAGNTVFTLLSHTGGATNQKSTIVVENDIWFYDSINNQIRSLGNERNFYTDPRTRALTQIIKRSMALLDPVQDNPVASYNKRVYRLSLKSLGSPTNNFTIIFDYDTGGFSIDIGQAINVATVYNGNIVYGEDGISGQTYQDDQGYTANGAAFAFEADTPFMDDSRPDTYKRARYIYFKGKLSYNQDTTIRLYRDGNYTTYSTYYIPSPAAQGVQQSTIMNDGQFGSAQQGNALWGGSSTIQNGIVLYEVDKLISCNQISNMFAIGLQSTINGGKVQCEQLILKVIDENENYKRSNI